MDCIFCKIISGDIPCYKVYEDENVLAFLDINPHENGHTVIIPKKHTLDFETINDEELSNILKATHKIKDILNEKLNIDGYTLLQNNGLPQEVKHYHLHILPKYKEERELLPIEEIYNKIK